jgi:hypothetical protein
MEEKGYTSLDQFRGKMSQDQEQKPVLIACTVHRVFQRQANNPQPTTSLNPTREHEQG